MPLRKELMWIVIGLMAITNPSEDDYVRWRVRRLAARLQDSACTDSRLPERLQGWGIPSLCEQSVDWVHESGLAYPMLNDATRHRNFALFSVYETTLLGQTSKVIGAFGLFFPISSTT
ncbi:MAG: hypothetical protein Kow00121_54250 [Elainellaceae cyanobacterium]